MTVTTAIDILKNSYTWFMFGTSSGSKVSFGPGDSVPVRPAGSKKDALNTVKGAYDWGIGGEGGDNGEAFAIGGEIDWQ